VLLVMRMSMSESPLVDGLRRVGKLGCPSGQGLPIVLVAPRLMSSAVLRKFQ
jgi:hypothetical protein